MRTMSTFAPVAAALLAVSSAGVARAAEIPNGSFEEGGDEPTGWTLSGGEGKWLIAGAAVGGRSVAVKGSGADSNYWRSGPIEFEPGRPYRVTFSARSMGASGGTPITGPAFCNRDLRRITGDWRRYASVFVVPKGAGPETSWLAFGQWHVKGAVAFDDVALLPARAVYARTGGVKLGEGERLSGREYVFNAPFGSDSRNHSRPLARHTCRFNTNRWTFVSGAEVVYRHRIGDARHAAATVEVGVTYHVEGEVVVSAGTDGERWTELGTVGRPESRAFDVPAALLPTREVWVRLAARVVREGRVVPGAGSVQVSGYGYRSKLDRSPAGEETLKGRTRFVAVAEEDPDLRVDFIGLGDGLPGGENFVTLRASSRSGRALRVRAAATVSRGGGAAPRREVRLAIARRARTFRLPYDVPGTGEFEMRIALEGDARFKAQASLSVAELYRADYGERLPDSTREVGLWWASSGWKVSRRRPVPAAEGGAVTIRAARNEAEAAQIVLRPRRALAGLTATAGELRGPGGAVIPAGHVEVLRVRYVDIALPTDPTGVADLWPDPLPPFRGPVDVEADENTPLWVRVKVPRDARAGVYRGEVRLAAHDYRATAPISVEVFDFDLPDRMTCVTAFGFSPAEAWRYHKVEAPEDRRALLEKYFRNLSAHHISPYDPAPMDPVRVTWPGAADWQGGKRDPENPHSGKTSLRVEDASATSQVSAAYGELVPIPEGGLRLRFHHRAAREGHPFIVTLNHHDAAGTWMPGRNNDMRVAGSREWRAFERTVTRFPPGAKSVRLSLWAAEWRDDGSTTGTVWYDDVSLADARTERELVRGGGFESVKPADLVPRFDWAAWDAAMTRAIDDHGFNSFRVKVPGMGGGTFHERHEPSLLGYSEDTPEYRAAFGNYCRALEGHLRERGWLDEAFVYWFDEPDPKDYAFVANGFRKLKAAAPAINRMLTEQVEPALAGGPNIWCPLTPSFDGPLTDERRRAGDRFWWYVCTGPKAPYCTLFIDHPATEMRVWLWQTWKRKIDGILIWQTNYWTSSAAYPDRARPQNPYADPMGWTSGYSTPAGQRVPWGNGDGRFIYPPEAAADARPANPVMDGPVDSIRWEMLRDGIEDYEYLVILRKLLAEKGPRLPRAQRREYEGLLRVPDSVSRSLTDFTKTPEPIEAHRHAVAKAIEYLTGTP